MKSKESVILKLIPVKGLLIFRAQRYILNAPLQVFLQKNSGLNLIERVLSARIRQNTSKCAKVIGMSPNELHLCCVSILLVVSVGS